MKLRKKKAKKRLEARIHDYENTVGKGDTKAYRKPGRSY